MEGLAYLLLAGVFMGVVALAWQLRRLSVTVEEIDRVLAAHVGAADDLQLDSQAMDAISPGSGRT